MNSICALSVTLKQLVDAGASKVSEEHRKLVTKLEERESFTYGDQITLTEVIDATDLKYTLFALKVSLKREQQEIQRQIAVQYAQRFRNRVRDPRGLAAIDAADKYSKGEITFEEMLQARKLALKASEEHRQVGGSKEIGRVLWLAAQTTELEPDQALWYCREITVELEPGIEKWATEVVRQTFTNL